MNFEWCDIQGEHRWQDAVNQSLGLEPLLTIGDRGVLAQVQPGQRERAAAGLECSYEAVGVHLILRDAAQPEMIAVANRSADGDVKPGWRERDHESPFSHAARACCAYDGDVACAQVERLIGFIAAEAREASRLASKCGAFPNWERSVYTRRAASASGTRPGRRSRPSGRSASSLARVAASSRPLRWLTAGAVACGGLAERFTCRPRARITAGSTPGHRQGDDSRGCSPAARRATRHVQRVRGRATKYPEKGVLHDLP